MQKCLAFFPGIDRDLQGHEGLMAAEECLPNRSRFYRVGFEISERSGALPKWCSTAWGERVQASEGFAHVDGLAIHIDPSGA